MPKSKKSKVQSPKSKAVKTKSRKIAQPRYASFRLAKKIKQPKAPLTGSFRLFAAASRLLLKEWRLFGGIVLVYLVLTLVLVKGFGINTDISELKSTVLEFFDGSTAELAAGFTLFTVLVSSANTATTEIAGAYQSVLLIIASLAFIWALRQSLGAKKVRVQIRDAFYKGMYPVIPFLLVLCVIGLQLLPLAIANFIYGIVFGENGLTATPPEQVLWVVLVGLLVLLSLYMITSSIFALYIVTLPDVRPMQALRSARELVQHRRWIIMRKVLFLPFILLVIAAAVVVPLIILSPALAAWVFFGLSMLSLAVVHCYFYLLYKELLA